LPCQGWAVEVMMLFKQLAHDHTPTGHGAPQAIFQIGIMLWRSRDARAPAGQEIAGPLAMPELVGIHGTCRTLWRSSKDPRSRREMAAVGHYRESPPGRGCGPAAAARRPPPTHTSPPADWPSRCTTPSGQCASIKLA
jgi:hypothetical protein